MSNYIVSTVQYNAVLHKNFYRNILRFADEHNVKKIQLFIMPGRNKDETQISKTLIDDKRVEFQFLGKDGLKLNNNLKLFDSKIHASQINPLTGFNKKLHRDYSYILPSPKIRFLTFPNTSKYPRFLATTGAITHGNYKEHTAQGRKAGLEHQYGFTFIEVKNNRIFNYHPIEAMKNGNFNHGREYYKNGKKYDQDPEALVLGDWHTGDTCPKVRRETIKMIAELKPKRVFFHDFFNGHSVNHHEQSNHLSKASSWKQQKHDLELEVKQCLKELQFFCNKFPDVQFFIVESNHDLFLNRYISENNFLADGANSVFSCKMFIGMATGKHQPALLSAMQLVGKIPNNVYFLSEDEEYRVRSVGLDYHGHRGINGARGTSASFDRMNLRLITGHEHSPKIYANGMVVGTSTHLKLNYTKGAGSWLNAHGLLYQSGKYTLMSFVF